ncbi:hypothetical protein ABZ687_28780 [Streptomyces ardesiacus]|uniref:hypothetical protein n=1 Tax=Streptomyces ardesiacus TaxID=285564 RepID=UPI0033D0EC3C
MAWDGIPWFVEGTAASEETLRLIVDAAMCGGEGVVGPADLLVTALDAPAAAVQVGPGAMIAKRRAALGGGSQSYAARMPTAEQADVVPVTVDGPRSDLVIARVEDPYGGEPWPAPEDPSVGPYVFTRVIPDVPVGTTSIRDIEPDSTAVTLARIDMPAGTTTITAAMVTDLRQLARPRSESFRRYIPGWQAPDDLGAITDVWETFPMGATWTEKIPDWATHVTVHALITGLLHPDAVEARGTLRASVGEQHGAAMPYACEAAGRTVLQTGHTFLLAPEDRGQMVDISLEGLGDAPYKGVLRADRGTALSLEVTYSQKPVSA